MEYYGEIKNAHMTIWMNLTKPESKKKVSQKRAYTSGIAQCKQNSVTYYKSE